VPLSFVCESGSVPLSFMCESGSVPLSYVGESGSVPLSYVCVIYIHVHVCCTHTYESPC